MANAFNLPGSTPVFTTKYILLARTRITYVEHDADGDWYFFGSEKVRSNEDYRKCTLDEILAIDRAVEQFADLPVDAYAFVNLRGEWERGENFQKGSLAFLSKKVLGEGLPILYVYRLEPESPEDSGWRFFSGTEDEAFATNPDNWAIVSLAGVLEQDTSLHELMEFVPGNTFSREEVGGDWTHYSQD